MQLTDFKLKTPDTYYITERDNGKVKSYKVEAEKITSNLFPEADLFIHKSAGLYRISEGHTGSWLVAGKTKAAAILLMSNILRGKRMQNGGFERIVLDAIYANGLSPRYEVINASK
jgi:hypothetical protein